MRAIGHALRLLGAALRAGLVAGAVAGLGSRVLMRTVGLMARSHYGEVTHQNAVVGLTTLEGTLNLVVQGAFMGVAGSLLYLLVRPWLPGRPVVRGLQFGLLLLLAFGGGVLDGNYEYFRYVSPALSVSLFALLYPLYGAALAPLFERWARDETNLAGWPLRMGRIAVAALAGAAGLNLLQHLRLEYQLFT